MASNYGKQFEAQFKKDWMLSFPNSFCLRLPDQQSGYFGTSQNICDFICFNDGILYLLECKSHKGNTFPFSNLTQFEKLSQYRNIDKIKIGVIVWFVEHDKVFFVPIDTVHKMVSDGKKSINVNKSLEEYTEIIDIPSQKKRTFMTSDYHVIGEI